MKTLGDLIGWASAKVQGSNELSKAKEKILSVELTKIAIILLIAYIAYSIVCKGGGGGSYAPRGGRF